MPWIWLKMVGTSKIKFHTAEFIKCIFIKFSFTELTILRQQGKGDAIFYSSLLLPPAHEHWDAYLQHCIWVDCLVFLIVVPVITKLLFDIDYRAFLVAAPNCYSTGFTPPLGVNILLNFNCIFLSCWFNAKSCCYNSLQTTGRFELVSTSTRQTIRLPKCSSQPKVYSVAVVAFDKDHKIKFIWAWH